MLTWDLAADFAADFVSDLPQNNPNGVWSYYGTDNTTTSLLVTSTVLRAHQGRILLASEPAGPNRPAFLPTRVAAILAFPLTPLQGTAPTRLSGQRRSMRPWELLRSAAY